MKKQNQSFKQRAIQRSVVIATAAFTILGINADDASKYDKASKGQGAAYGQQAGHGDKSQHFIKQALMGGEMEVKMAQLGQQKAQNAEVKRLAERLVQDHQQANQELQQIAQKKSITADPAHASKDEKHAKGMAKMEELKNASGTEFDKEFTKCAIKHHKKTIAKFEKVSADQQDAELKAFVDKTLPKLKEHLTLAQTAAASIGLSQSDLAALDRELETDAAGAPAAGESAVGGQRDPGELHPADDVDKARDNQKQKDSGSPAPGEQGENKNLTPDASGSAPEASIESNSGIDAATQSNASGTINQNTPAATDNSASANIHTDGDLNRVDDASGAAATSDKGSGVSASGNIGDSEAEIDANVDVDTDEPGASIETEAELNTDKNDGKILGVESQEGDGKTLGVETDPNDGKTLGVETNPNDGKTLGVTTEPNDGETLGVTTRKSDGKVLGLPTSNSDGKLLGVIPWFKNRGDDKNSGADAEVQIGDKSIKGEVDVDTDVGGPAEAESGSDERVEPVKP